MWLQLQIQNLEFWLTSLLRLGKTLLVFQAGFPFPPQPVTLWPYMQNFVYQLTGYLLWLECWKGSEDSLLNILLSYSLLPETKSLSNFHLHHSLSTIIIISGVCTSLLHLIHRSKYNQRKCLQHLWSLH